MLRQVALLLAIAALAVPARAEHPSNGWIVWASNRNDNRHEIYRMKADGSRPTRLTFNGGTMASWSPDGRWIAYRNGAGAVHIMAWDGSDDREVLAAGKPWFWYHDRSGLFVGDDKHNYYRYSPRTGARDYLFARGDFSRIGDAGFDPRGITHDGRFLLAHTTRFAHGYKADNGVLKAGHAAVAVDLGFKESLFIIGPGCEPNASPRGSLVYHVCGHKEECPLVPDIMKLDMADIMSRSSYRVEVSAPDPDWGHEYFPRVSNDNRWLVYGASTGCHDHDSCNYEIFIHRLGAGRQSRVRLTHHPQNDRWPHLFVGVPRH